MNQNTYKPKNVIEENNEKEKKDAKFNMVKYLKNYLLCMIITKAKK